MFDFEFDLQHLKSIDWINLLKERPEFIELCNFEAFIKDDPFDLISLIVMFPSMDFREYFNRINKSKITGYGWQLLLVANKFIEECDFEKLEKSNWTEVLKKRPELVTYKIQ